MRLDEKNLPGFLAERGLLPGGADPASASVESPGEGNINFVRRVRCGDRSVVVKQARGELERFPEYAASPERLRHELRYVREVHALAPTVAHVLPDVLHFDAEHMVAVIEDLGDVPTLESALVRGDRPAHALAELGRFLGCVARASEPRAHTLAAEFQNEEMRALHGEHIFTLPFAGDGFPVSPTVRTEADRLLTADVRDRIAVARSRYYDSAQALVHADVQGSNVLLQPTGPRLLDAEIAHVGDPAFDLGSLRAHVLVHAPQDPAANERLVAGLLKAFVAAGGRDEEVAWSETYAGIELLRRILGAARFQHLSEESDSIRGDSNTVAVLASGVAAVKAGPTRSKILGPIV